MTARRSLIMTLPPFQGGVRHMVRVMADRLRRCGDAVTVAYDATFNHAPKLVAPTAASPNPGSANGCDGWARSTATPSPGSRQWRAASR